MTQQINRRTVTKGIAWSVPAVALAGAAPAFAASPGDITGPPITKGCKLPGSSCEGKSGIKFGYTFTITLCNADTVPVDVTFLPSTISINGTAHTFAIYTGPTTGGGNSSTATIPAEDCKTFYIYVDSGNSAEAAITGSIDFTYPANFGNDPHEGSVEVNIPTVGPCNKDTCAPNLADTTAVGDGSEGTTENATTGAGAEGQANTDASQTQASETPSEANSIQPKSETLPVEEPQLDVAEPGADAEIVLSEDNA